MITLVASIGVGVVMASVALLLVVMSVMNGFSSDLRSKILGANAHLMVLKYGKDFETRIARTYLLGWGREDNALRQIHWLNE